MNLPTSVTQRMASIKFFHKSKIAREMLSAPLTGVFQAWIGVRQEEGAKGSSRMERGPQAASRSCWARAELRGSWPKEISGFAVAAQDNKTLPLLQEDSTATCSRAKMQQKVPASRQVAVHLPASIPQVVPTVLKGAKHDAKDGHSQLPAPGGGGFVKDPVLPPLHCPAKHNQSKAPAPHSTCSNSLGSRWPLAGWC